MLKRIVPGLRGAAALTLILIVVAALAAACSSPTPTPTAAPQPSPTPTATATPTPLPPTSTPTATPRPAPTPTATATPTPLLPTPTKAPAAPTSAPTVPQGPVGDLEITADTTVGDIMGVLSQDEVSCLRDAIGPAVFDTIQDIPISIAPPGTMEALPFECLTPENAIAIGIAMMSAEAGGLSAETRGCISALAMENPGVLGIGEPPEDPAALLGTAIQMQFCLTNQEASRIGADIGGELLPPPSVFRCVEEELGSLDDFLSFITGAEPNPEKLLGVVAAAQKCGMRIEMAPPEGGSGSGQ